MDDLDGRMHAFRASRENCRGLIDGFNACMRRGREGLADPECAALHLQQNVCVGSFVCPREARVVYEEGAASPESQRALSACVKDFYARLKRDHAARKRQADCAAARRRLGERTRPGGALGRQTVGAQAGGRHV